MPPPESLPALLPVALVRPTLDRMERAATIRSRRVDCRNGGGNGCCGARRANLRKRVRMTYSAASRVRAADPLLEIGERAGA